MKFKISILLLTSLFLFGFEYEEKDLVSLEEFTFSEATAYNYRWTNGMSGAIPTGEKIIKTIQVTGTELDKLEKLVNNKNLFTSYKSAAACFQPRHTLVLYDEQENVTTLKICFACHNFTVNSCLLYTSPSPRDLSTSRMPSSA